MRYILQLLLVGTLLTSCELWSSDFHEKNVELAKIQGEWELELMTGGYGGGIVYPDTANYYDFKEVKSITLVINGSRAEWFVDDTLSKVERIEYDRRSSSNLTFETALRPKDHFSISRKYLLKDHKTDTTFTLLDSCFDCFHYYFIKN